ncbi:MAG: diacylglycerol/lipid kinase family protein [Anaerolineae bacterium]|jgi:diacylglycerol kinase (ATP)|nr:hypothetical protein [Chloroflexota bacterium]
MHHVCVIANPASGGANIEQLALALEEIFVEPWTYELHLTRRGEDLAAWVASRLWDGADLFVAAGGDGTVRSVAGALLGSGVPLGIIPMGTANILAHDLRLPLRLGPALALIAGDHAMLDLDAIQAQGSCALLNLSMGFSPEIIRGTGSQEKRRYGMFAYLWAGLRKLFTARVREMVLVLDGQERRLRATEVFVANCPSLGIPELTITERIDPTDGTLQVIVFRGRSVADYVVAAWELLTRRGRSGRTLQVFPVRETVSILSPQGLDVQADGDLLGSTPLTAQLLPGAVRVIVPQDRAAGRRARLPGQIQMEGR